MTRRLDVQSRHREQIERLLREHLPAVEVWAYGSRVNGQSHAGSDLDLVLRSPGLVEIDSSQLAEFNEAVQESTIPFLIEARDWARLPESFHREIEREYVVLVEKEEQRVGGEWRRYEARALIEAGVLEIGDGYRAKKNELATSGLPFARAGNIKDGFQFTDVDRFPEEDLERVGNKTSKPSDVVFTSKGTVGRFAFVREDTPRFVYSPQLCFWRSLNHERIDPRFLFYWLSGREFYIQFKSVSGQTDMAEYVSLQDQRSMHLTLPPLPEQRAIAHILGSLDDKIELNRRMNETLEEMARALFKSWFIDFDPVHAKAALKRPSPPLITPPLRGSRQAKGDSPQARRWGVVRRSYTQHAQQKARSLRENQTDAEGLLWHYLHHKQLDGHKFRRQQPIGPYIVDFACMPRKVIVELDGGQHAERRSHDERRDRFLQGQGYRLLRFWNNEVFENCFGVLERIYEAVQNPPPPQPAPDGLTSATPPQGGSDRTGKKAWTVERARAYLDRMDPSIAALFPDCFVDSELGEVPEGWEVKALGDCFHLTMGQSPPGNTYNDNGDGLPFFQGCTDFGFRYPQNRRFCTAPTRIAEQNDTLVSVRAPVGDINMALEKCCVGRGVAALRHKSGSRSFTYYSIWAIQQELRQYEHTGTVFGAINKKQFEMLKTMEPPLELIHALESLIGPMDEYIKTHVSESRTLTALRNTLLPKLVSGEVRIPKDLIQ